MQFKEENNYPKALLISTGIMGTLIALSFFFVISKFQPEEEFGMGGIAVNWGTVEVGMGNDILSTEEPSADPNANNELPDKVNLETQANQAKSSQDTRNLATQNLENTASVNSKNSKTVNSSANNNNTKTPQINQQALYKGNKSTGAGRGDGTGNTAGNQGRELGDPMAPNYGDGGSGFGDTPIELGKFSNLVKPEDDTQARGRVAIRITINKQGVITHAEFSNKFSTTSDRRLVQKSIDAMLGARYNGTERAPDVRKGVVVFSYGLN